MQNLLLFGPANASSAVLGGGVCHELFELEPVDPILFS